MRAPGFWYQDPGLRSSLLAPLASLYTAATQKRLKNGNRHKIGVPVICVGNINAGGTGKTPTVIELVTRLTALGAAPHVVSRGYGGSLSGPTLVSTKNHTSDETGDEPLLISPFAPVWVAKDRAAGARAAVAAGASVVVLDDGHQNPSLHHDLSIVVVDAARGFGNGKVMPAGPLREPVAIGLSRADLLLSIGTSVEQANFLTPLAEHLTHITGGLTPVETGMSWTGMKVVAFAGIGHPEKFFKTLRSLGADLVGTHSLDDHQPLERALLQRLAQEAATKGAQLVTTEKDAVRIPSDLRAGIFSLPVRLKINEPEILDHALAATVS